MHHTQSSFQSIHTDTFRNFPRKLETQFFLSTKWTSFITEQICGIISKMNSNTRESAETKLKNNPYEKSIFGARSQRRNKMRQLPQSHRQLSQNLNNSFLVSSSNGNLPLFVLDAVIVKLQNVGRIDDEGAVYPQKYFGKLILKF